MDTVYYYHHPDQIPNQPQTEVRDGFYNPFELVMEGVMQRKRTGLTPDPEKLMKRLNRRWKGDLDYLERLIENGRPKPETE